MEQILGGGEDELLWDPFIGSDIKVTSRQTVDDMNLDMRIRAE